MLREHSAMWNFTQKSQQHTPTRYAKLSASQSVQYLDPTSVRTARKHSHSPVVHWLDIFNLRLTSNSSCRNTKLYSTLYKSLQTWTSVHTFWSRLPRTALTQEFSPTENYDPQRTQCLLTKMFSLTPKITSDPPWIPVLKPYSNF